MADDIAIKPDKQKARLALKLKEECNIVLALLPGSRKREGGYITPCVYSILFAVEVGC